MVIEIRVVFMCEGISRWLIVSFSGFGWWLHGVFIL